MAGSGARCSHTVGTENTFIGGKSVVVAED